jgi:DNA-binding NarL/FixJ family response regulator
MPGTSVVIAEDSAILRDGLVGLLQQAGIRVKAALGDATRLMEVVAGDPPDVVVLDVRMPPTHTTEGLEAALALREHFPDVGVLVLSQYLEPRYAVQLLESTSSGIGYLLKERISESRELISSIERIAEGASVIDDHVVERLLTRRRIQSPIDELTEREHDVLRLMAAGRTNAEISEELFVGIKTVEAHVRSIFMKLELSEDQGNRRVLAVLEWLREH